MTNTTAEFWGWTPPGGAEISLAQPWLTVATFGGSRMGIPTLRGNDYEVPFRSGLQHRPKFANSRTLTLAMSVSGTDPATGLPAADDQVLQWNNNFQEIRQAFWTRDPLGSVQGMLTRRWNLTQNGTTGVVVASAMAEIGSDMAPAMTGRTRADFAVDLVLSDPYFYGTQRSVVIGAGAPVTVMTLGEGIVGEGYPSSVSSFTCQLSGPLSFPVLTNSSATSAASSAGVIFAYQDVVALGETVTIDFLNFTVASSTGASKVNKVAHAGSKMWFCLVPSPIPGQPGNNQVALTTLSATDTGTATLFYNDCYI